MKQDKLFQSKKDRRGSVLRWCVIGGLLMAAGFLLLWKPAAGVDSGPESTPGPSPRVSAAPVEQSQRSARELAYDKDMEALQELIGREDVDQAVRDQAAAQLSRMVENHQTELAIEEALLEAGYSPCLVVMQSDAITVNLQGAELSGDEGAQVLSICVAHSDVAVENIRIMTRTQ